MNHRSEEEMMDLLLKWADSQDVIRGLLLTSSRADPDATIDVFSDFDVIVIVTDPQQFFDNDAWLEEFGTVITLYKDPVHIEYGFEALARITQYEDANKIDFAIWSVGLLQGIVDSNELPDHLDAGYKVLVDKDGLANQLKPPTYATFIPSIPTEEEYQMVITEFFNITAYVAKNICRGDLMQLKYCLDFLAKHDYLLKVFQWKIEIDNDWSINPGRGGKGLKKHLDPETWSEFERTYVGAGKEENWEALFSTIALFRNVAVEVANQLGFSYPYSLDERVLKYIYAVKDADK